MGPTCLDIDLASWGPYQLDVFVSGPDKAVYQRSFDDGVWGQWVDQGGYSEYTIAAIAPAPKWLELYLIGPDHALYQKTYK